MRTRSSKLTEDAAESDGTPGSNTDDGKTMNLSLDSASIIATDSKIDEEISASETHDQGGKKIGDDASDSVRTEEGATSVTSAEEVASDSITAEEGVTSNISQTVEGAPGSVKMEDAPSSTTSSTVEGDASKMEHTLVESVAQSVVCSLEKSIAAEEMTADVLTMETDSSSTTVPNALTESMTNSVQIEGSPTTEGDTTNMEELPKKSIDNGKVNDACVTTNERTQEENISKRQYINQYTAEFKIIGRKFCEERNIPFPNQATFKKIIYDLYKNQKFDEKNLKIKLEEAAQRKLNASSGPMEIEGSRTTEGDTTNMEELPEKSIDNGKVNDACVTTKSEVVPEALEKKTYKRKPDENKSMCKYINEYAAEFKIMGRKFCEERNIPFPNRATVKKIVFDLYKNQKLDMKNLEVKLEEAAQGKLNASARPMATETSKKFIGGEVSDTKEEGKQSISSGNDVDPESPDKSISENEAVQREVEAKFEEYRDIGVKYCVSKQLKIPGWVRFKEIMSDLASKQLLNVTELKAVLDIHGLLLKEQTIWFGPRKIKPRLDAKGEMLPSVVKRLVNMTTEERVAFFEEFNTFRTTMKPIAIKHCHTIKAPFPPIKQFNMICRDLFDIGLLDEENMKFEIEMDFEQKCKMPLKEEQIKIILRRYCADNGIDNIGIKRMMAEILPKMSQELLCQKHYWNVMYKERKTNLFMDEQLNPEAIKRGPPEDSKPSEAANNDRPVEVALCDGDRMTKPSLDAKSGQSAVNKVAEMTTGERTAFFQELNTLKAAMRLIAIKHCHTIKAPLPGVKHFNKICRDLFEVGMLNEENIKLAVQKDFEKSCNLPLDDEQITYVLKRYRADNGLVDIGVKRMKAEILPQLPKELLCQKHFWNLLYEEKKTNLFLNSPTFEAVRKSIPEGSKASNAASGVQKNGAKTGGVASKPESKRKNQDPITSRPPKKKVVWQTECLHAMGLPWSNEKLSKITENSQDRYDRDPWNASSSGATRNAASSSYTNTSSRRLDEEPIQKLLPSQQRNAEKARMLGRLDSQGSVFSQSRPSLNESRWGQNQDQRGKGMNVEKPNPSHSIPFVELGKTCKVAVVHEDYPRRRVTDQEANLIRTALLGLGGKSGVRPRFSHMFHERGAVIFECEDQLTVSWLWVNASTIIPWRSAKLRATSWEESPKEVSIYVPELLDYLTPQALCERLMRQNPSLSTENWKLKSSDSTSPKGPNFVFYIDDESMKTLKSLDFQPHLGFSRVTVYVNQE